MIKIKSFYGKFGKLFPITFVLLALGVTLYPVAISPMIDSSKYKKIQKISRKGIKQEDIQPGNMKVWSDPFNGNRNTGK